MTCQVCGSPWTNEPVFNTATGKQVAGKRSGSSGSSGSSSPSSSAAAGTGRSSGTGTGSRGLGLFLAVVILGIIAGICWAVFINPHGRAAETVCALAAEETAEPSCGEGSAGPEIYEEQTDRAPA